MVRARPRRPRTNLMANSSPTLLPTLLPTLGPLTPDIVEIVDPERVYCRVLGDVTGPRADMLDIMVWLEERYAWHSMRRMQMGQNNDGSCTVSFTIVRARDHDFGAMISFVHSVNTFRYGLAYDLFEDRACAIPYNPMI